MEWMEPIIPIEHCQLYIRPMGIWDRIGLMSINSRVEGVVTHSQGREDGRCSGFSVCPTLSLLSSY